MNVAGCFYPDLSEIQKQNGEAKDVKILLLARKEGPKTLGSRRVWLLKRYANYFISGKKERYFEGISENDQTPSSQDQWYKRINNFEIFCFEKRGPGHPAHSWPPREIFP